MKKPLVVIVAAAFVALGAGAAFAHPESPIDGVHPNFRMGAQDPAVAPGVNLPIGSIFRRDASRYYTKVGTANTAWQLIGTGGGASPDVSLTTFGAACDGATNDSAAMLAGLTYSNVTGGTVLMPSGKTCLTRPINMGSIAGLKANGVRLRGGGQSGASASTLLVQPAANQGGDCTMLTDNTTSPVANGGITIGPDVGRVTLEDMVIRAGSNLGNCLVNISHTTTSTPSGDPTFNTFRNVAFNGRGGGTPTHDDVFFGNASWVTFDGCTFGLGSNHHMREDGISSYLTASRFLWNSFFCAGGTGAAVSLNAPTDIDFSSNTFEVCPVGVYAGFSYAGTWANNWFNMEGVSSAAGRYYMDIGCGGCSIDGNWFSGNVDAVNVRAAAGRVTNNYFVGQSGSAVTVASTPYVVDAVAVEGNYFHGGTTASTNLIDIDVKSGKGHRITGNRYYSEAGVRESKYSVQVAAGTTGYMEVNVNTDLTPQGVHDLSSGGWLFFADQIFSQLKFDVSLATGLVKHATATGALSIATAGTDYLYPGGVAGGQTWTCGTAAGNSCTLTSTSNGTKGSLTLGTSGSDLVIDQAGHKLGLGVAAPAAKAEFVTATDTSDGGPGSWDDKFVTVGESGASGGKLAFSWRSSSQGAFITSLKPGTAYRDIQYKAANHTFFSGSLAATTALTLDSSGHVYGGGVHNNASPCTGTNGYLCSGTYTPTLTAVANVDSSSPAVCQYLRVGRVVQVGCAMVINATSAATLTKLGVSLPLASNLAGTLDATGTCAADDEAFLSAGVRADATNDRAEVIYTSGVFVGDANFHCTWTYLVN